LLASLRAEISKKLKRTWDNASLGAKTLREIMLNNSQKKTWDRANLRKEILENRREDFKSKVLKNYKGVRP
jgi:hypothetical protein